jgi:hypothetical protein
VRCALFCNSSPTPSVHVRLSPETSRWLHATLQPLKRRLLEVRAARHAGSRVRRIPISQLPTAATESVIHLTKNSCGRLEIAASLDWLRSRNGFSTTWRRVGVFVNLLADPQVPSGCWQADLGDWVRPTGPVAGFCSPHRGSRLVPDRGFIRSSGYAAARQIASRAPRWSERRPTFVWRGGPNGHGLYASDTMDWRDQQLRQRVRLCLLGKSLADASRFADAPIDLRLVSVPQHDPQAAARLRASGIIGNPIPARSWLQRQFAIDIDGYANAFSNFFLRLLYGCCVLKVASPRGFRQWYYDRLVPWVHYVPVAADLSDFAERLDWCRRHPRQCREIAGVGQRAAFAMTYDRERQQAIEQLVQPIS